MTELVAVFFHLFGSRARRLRNLIGKVVTYDHTEPEPVAEPKTRLCLRCKAPFQSQWSGERICRRCKSAKIWRTSNVATERRR